MSSVDSIVSVAITAQTTTPTKPGFGIPLIAGYFENWASTDLVRAYTDVDGLVADGFTSSSAVYLAAQAILQQTPHPEYFLVGRLTTPYTPGVTLTITDATEGAKYTLQVGANTATTYTVLASATTSTVATAIAALLDALTGYDASAVGSQITLEWTAGDGDPIRVRNWSSNIELRMTGTATNLEDELTAIKVANNDWYGLVMAAPDEATGNAAAAWAETNKKYLGLTSSDKAVKDSGSTTDVAALSNAASYKYTNVSFHGTDTLGYRGAAIMSLTFTMVPGSYTAKFKNLAGQVIDTLTETERQTILSKKANIYTSVAGVGMYEEGWQSSGQFSDERRGLDWLETEVKFRVFTLLLNQQKVPYTEAGMEQVATEIRGALSLGEANGLLVPDQSTVAVPKISTVSSADKGARVLNNVKFTAVLQGAIHRVVIQGTVTL